MAVASIITAAYDAQASLPAAVQSVLSQSMPDWEMLIVADDGNDYAETLRRLGISDSRIRFLSTGGYGRGPGVARNIAADQAKASIIVNLDADDHISTHYLERMVPVAMEQGAATPSIIVINSDDHSVRHHTVPPQGVSALALPEIIACRPTYAPIAYDRRRYRHAWPELMYGEDLIFWLALYGSGTPVAYVSSATYYYHYRTGSLSRPEDATTHALCHKRQLMIGWLKESPLFPATVRLAVEWLEECNAMEAAFGYRLVELETYQREVEKRLLAVLAKAAP